MARKSVVDALVEMYKFVVVAEVPVAVEKLKSVSVEEAVDRNPFKNAKVVEVACSPVPSFVNAQGKPLPPEGQELLQSPERQKVVAARLVEVALVVVALVAVKVVRVEEAVETNPALNSSVVEVAFSPVPNFKNG